MTPARVPVPGDTIRSELKTRGWTQKTLAVLTKRSPQCISEIINGKRRIAVETAFRIEDALGLSARFLMTLDSNYRLYLERQKREKA